MYNDMSLR